MITSRKVTLACAVTLLLQLSPTILFARKKAYIPAYQTTDEAALLRAARCGNTSCLSKLVAQGIDINSRDDRGNTALMHAIISDSFDTEEAIDFLLAAGANTCIPAYDGTMPLQMAFTSGKLSAAEKIFATTMARREQLDLSQKKPSIAMIISDLKFSDDGKITILELGEGPLSYFKGHDALYPKGQIWDNFWHYLAHKNLPMWQVGNLAAAQRETVEAGLLTFKKLGGELSPSLHNLEKLPSFKKIITHARERNTSPAGIVLLRHHNTNQAMLNYFKTTYPEIIVIDEISRPFVNSKFMTNLLFKNDPDLSMFRPMCKTYHKEFSKQLIKSIEQDFGTTGDVVIKPLDAANGWGVIITPMTQLKRELRKIFFDKEFLEGSMDSTYSYWLTDRNDHFIVENFVPSKPIMVSNRRYDATMRQVFVVESNQNGIHTTFIGSYWKLPAVSLDHAGSSTEKHKSNVKASRKPSAEVSEEDNLIVRNTLSYIIPRIYAKMLQSL